MTSVTTHASHAHFAAIDLEAIASLSDPIGVLSVYVDADPALVVGPRPAWQAPVRASLRRLLNDTRQTRPRAERLAVAAWLRELEPELDALLDPRLGGRGRALFAAVSGGELHRIELRAPLPSLVRLESAACVLPLLAAGRECKPAGVATVSWDRLELAEWEFDTLHRLDAFELAEPPQRQARPATNPAVPQSFPERDRFASALGARVAARLREAGARLARQSKARGWDLVVVGGDPRLVEVLSDTLRSRPFRLVPSSRPIAGLADAAAAERVGAIVREERSKRDAELLRKLHSSPASTGDPRVLERSLDEGRVEHLLISAPEQPSQATIRESLLRRALETGAEVTVFARGAPELGTSGASALLRW
jgi:hypothetical protein